jgi:hypothetical protein
MGGQAASRTKEAERRHEGGQSASEGASLEDQEYRRGVVLLGGACNGGKGAAACFLGSKKWRGGKCARACSSFRRRMHSASRPCGCGKTFKRISPSFYNWLRLLLLETTPNETRSKARENRSAQCAC